MKFYIIKSRPFVFSDGVRTGNACRGYMDGFVRSVSMFHGGKTFTATLSDNSSAEALKELLSKGDVTVEMEDYGNMEKVGPLPTALPRNDRQTSTGPGDIILYQGKYLVIYYSTNSWNFTRIGKIDNADAAQLKSALGCGDVTVTLSSGR